MKLSSQFFIFIIVIGSLISAEEQPPRHGRLIQPRDNSVVTENILKIAAPQCIGKDTVIKVYFYAKFSMLATNKLTRSVIDTLIDIDSIPPFETIWDCTRIPDQDNTNLRLYFRALAGHGKKIGRNREYRTSITLDRNKKLSKMKWLSYKSERPVNIDGKLEEWFQEDSVVFETNDNRITASSKWDKDFLYFGIRIQDAYMFPPDTGERYNRIAPYLQDGIEFFFDLKHDHNIVRNQDDYQVIVPVNGTLHKVNLIFKTHYPQKKKRPEWNPNIRLLGTSYGYNVEAAFSWKEFSFSPEPGLTIGFNLVNSDREDENGVVMTKSWANISDLLHHNPSEWGNLVLADNSRLGQLIVILSCTILVLLTILVTLIRKRKLRNKNADTEKSKQRLLVDAVKEHVRQNFRNESYDMKKAALEVNLSPDYLRKIFKKETGENFTAYLNRIRIEEAKAVLKSTHKRITEVAFEVGYGSLEYFNKVFKNVEGLTPSEFRKQHFSE
jgi:AraC-like DNA-binding protein